MQTESDYNLFDVMGDDMLIEANVISDIGGKKHWKALQSSITEKEY